MGIVFLADHRYNNVHQASTRFECNFFLFWLLLVISDCYQIRTQWHFTIPYNLSCFLSHTEWWNIWSAMKIWQALLFCVFVRYFSLVIHNLWIIGTHLDSIRCLITNEKISLTFRMALLIRDTVTLTAYVFRWLRYIDRLNKIKTIKSC